MNDNQRDPLETLLVDAHSQHAPAHLKTAVLSQVNRQLKSSRWERRLARTAASVLMLGLALNVMLMRSEMAIPTTNRYAEFLGEDSIVQMGKTVAEVTDAETGTLYAKQLAFFYGRQLTEQQSNAIDRPRRVVSPL
jgi:hypothetical protein